ncbi:unnamed protein product [Protopolystoma xenopodis]|uniref:Uncharacterized protein n=1 Tax=Protopolystoma xenopodis TaxID=117903 RepID=A0A448XRY0_9PLAT|nr:unnamed protein product [Protopolystoma xenopodis]
MKNQLSSARLSVYDHLRSSCQSSFPNIGRCSSSFISAGAAIQMEEVRASAMNKCYQSSQPKEEMLSKACGSDDSAIEHPGTICKRSNTVASCFAPTIDPPPQVLSLFFICARMLKVCRLHTNCFLLPCKIRT